jgi:hypothetical protein
MIDVTLSEFIFTLLASSMTGIAGLLVLKLYLQARNRSLLYFTFLLFFDVMEIICEGITFYFPTIERVQLTFILYIPIAFTATIFIDSISREFIDPKKLVIISFMSSYFLWKLFSPESIMIFPNIILSNSATYALECLNVFLGLIILGYLTKILIRSPSKLRKWAIIALTGAFLVTIGSSLMVILQVNYIIPGIHFLFQGIGFVLLVFAIYHQPGLLFILPFKIYRLTIIESAGGIPVYNYTWNQPNSKFDEILYSGMLQAVRLILNESLAGAQLKEMKMKEATILLDYQENPKFIITLLASRSSLYLIKALESFTNDFVQKFRNADLNGNLLSEFRSAEKMIQKYFFFIP